MNSQEVTQSTEEDNDYSKLIKENLMNKGTYTMISDSFSSQVQPKINSFKHQFEMPTSLSDSIHMLYEKAVKTHEVKKITRILPSGPEKILDAPDLLNDY